MEHLTIVLVLLAHTPEGISPADPDFYDSLETNFTSIEDCWSLADEIQLREEIAFAGCRAEPTGEST